MNIQPGGHVPNIIAIMGRLFFGADPQDTLCSAAAGPGAPGGIPECIKIRPDASYAPVHRYSALPWGDEAPEPRETLEASAAPYTYRGVCIGARRLAHVDDELVDVIDTPTVRDAVRWARSDVRAGVADRVDVYSLEGRELVAVVRPGSIARGGS